MSYVSKRVGQFSFQIWDTAGKELFESLVPIYLRNAKYVIIVFNPQKRQSWDKVDLWYTTAKSCARNFRIILAKNIGLQGINNPAIDEGEIEEYSRANDIIGYLSFNSEDHGSVIRVFQYIGTDISNNS